MIGKFMCKFVNWILIGLTLTGLVACAGPLQPAVTPSPPAVPPARSVTLTVTANTEIGQKPDYTLTTELPTLQGVPAAQAARFDADVAALVQTQGSDFKKGLQEMTVPPLTAASFLDQRIGLVSMVAATISLKLVTFAYVSGAAHPYHLSVSYNFDLATGQALSLDELFLPGSNYMETIANFCKTELAARNIGFDASNQGADPTPENYQVWNLTADGLLITFNEYQVAAYAAGPQTVVIPYAELKGLISPQGPMATFVP